jgi:hypothetical protein
LVFEAAVRLFHFPEREAGKVAVAARIAALREMVVLSLLILVLLGSCGLLIAQPVRLVARLSVPCLDETWQKRKSPKNSFESHFKPRIRLFMPLCKLFMSWK